MPKQFDTDSPSIEEIMERRKPRTESAWVPLDAEVLNRISELETQIPMEERRDERRTDRAPVAPQLREELEGLREHAHESAVQFTFEALGRKAYRDLIDEHPPQDEDRERAKAQFGDQRMARWHSDTFVPALMAACAVEPEMDLEHAQRIWDEWDMAVAELIGGMAIAANEGETKVPPFVRGTGRTNGSPPSSTSASATDEESDTTSS